MLLEDIKVIAVRDSLVEECPVVNRVRKLLGEVDDVHPWSRSKIERGLGDLQDVENRLAQLKIFFPDVDVEEGPLVSRARSLLARRMAAGK